ncbi:hypothetical protein OF855_10955 [Mycolicibacterium fortuitum]|uniref:hypothetical protein n=1 Tax=Mycolicibacterium fortuitum TaxID=1766 RepID=UPI0022BA30EA|nr:hypothetical protein [Mycolicibacterium fortuitum]WAY21541.1 hypothetical protein OF855_10955 [Mycolicibacterium fortuitum]
MNDAQQKIVKVLQGRSSRLAGMYEMALRTLQTPAESGLESARVSIICHCIRELMMGVQTVLIDDPIERVRPSSGDLARKLRVLADKYPQLDLGAEEELIPVPKAVARVIDSLISAARKEYGRNRDNVAALVTGGGERNRNHPTVSQWLDMYNEYFVRWAHIDSHGDRPLPTDVELLTSIKFVEDVIDVCTAPFFGNLSAVKDLLDDINATFEE